MGAFALRVLPVCFLFLLVPASLTLAGQNFPLVRNGDFRLQHGNRLDMRQSWLAGHTMKFEEAEGPNDAPAVLMDKPNGAIFQDLSLVPGDYVLSVEVKVSPNGKARVQAGDLFKEQGETSGWQRVSVKFVSDGDPVRITLDNPTPSKGAVRFRDVRVDIEKLNSSAVPVAEGESIGRIVLAPDAEPAEQYAAWELQHFVWRMTGHTPGLAGRDEVFPGRTVFVGRAAKGAEVDSLTPMKDESYVVVENDASLMLAGKTARGTLYAVYDFLKTQGCRWFLPGSRGQVVPQHDALNIEAGVRTESPDWDIRGFLLHPSQYYHNGSWVNVLGDDYFDWAVRNRINAVWHGGLYTDDLGAHRGYSHTQRLNHSWHSFYPEDGPAEWSALVKGKRMRYYPAGRPNMVCTSNPDYRDAAVKVILHYFKKNPHAAAYACSADDEPAYWCECKNCRSQDPDEGKRPWITAPDGRPTLSMTDRAIHLANEVAERVSQVYPDKLIEMYAYGSTSSPPTRFKVHPNVLIKVCYWSPSPVRPMLDETYEIYREDIERLDTWKKMGVKNFGLYDYGSYNNIDCPIFWFFTISDSLKTLYEKWGFRHYLGETDNTIGPSMVAFNLRARALWDRNVEYKKVIQDLCERFYGPAAKEMIEYYTLMHDALLNWNKPKDVEPTWIGWGSEYDLEVMKNGQAVLDRAAAQVAADKTLKSRVDIAQFGHSQFTLWIATNKRRPHPEPVTAESVALAKAAHKRVLELWGQNGNLVLNGTRNDLVNFRPEPIVEKALVELPIRGLFKTDPDKVGLDQKWYREESMPDGWGRIQLDDFWTRQEPYINYRGVGWYRVKFQVPADVRETMKEALAQGKVALLFGAVDGIVDVFLDGDKIGEQKVPAAVMWDKPFSIMLPNTLNPAAEHELVVRVEKDKYAAGIWKPVSVAIVDRQ